MPGPVSDSYDPEFGPGERTRAVADALKAVRRRLAHVIGTDALRDIVAVAKDRNGPRELFAVSERELRLLRFAINRALETL